MSKLESLIGIVILVFFCLWFVSGIANDQIDRAAAGEPHSEIGDICQGAAIVAAIVAIPCYLAGAKK